MAATPATSTAPRRGMLRDAMKNGTAALVAAVLLLLVMALSPAPYALRLPGETYNAIGDVTLEEGADPVPVINISGAESYEPTSGQLDVMTVSIAGSPRTMPGWVEAFAAYVIDERDVLPIEVYYPEGQSSEDRAQQNESMMQSSQGEAVAAALNHQGHDVTVDVVVADVSAEGPSGGQLEPGDLITSVNGTEIVEFDDVSTALEGNEGTPVPVTVERSEERIDLEITPEISVPEGEPEARPLLGIIVTGAYDFPVDVDIELGDVGGPSAGLIFSLAILDKLTPGDLTGGQHIAGTGTITADGEVGAIGGIRQKLHAADVTGAEAFLAPVDNCAEVLDGGIPGDLPVYAVSTLDEALTAVETTASGGDTSTLPTCQSVSSGAEAALD